MEPADPSDVAATRAFVRHVIERADHEMRARELIARRLAEKHRGGRGDHGAPVRSSGPGRSGFDPAHPPAGRPRAAGLGHDGRRTEMKSSPSPEGPSSSSLIDARIAELGDWRGETLGRVRGLIRQADPEVVEEWKWRGVPVWSHDGILCTGEVLQGRDQADLRQRGGAGGSFRPVQFQPRGKRAAGHRYSRRREPQ